VHELISSYGAVGCNMSLILHLLYSHLGFFPENTGVISAEHGEKFHHDISQTEKRYSGKWYIDILVD
jgi:hypothetical protein